MRDVIERPERDAGGHDTYWEKRAVNDTREGLVVLRGGPTVLHVSDPPILVRTGPGGDEWVAVRRAVAPRLPHGALGARTSVAIGVDIHVGDDGVPSTAATLDAHDPALETAALIAALQWRFNMNPSPGAAARDFMLLFVFESDENAQAAEPSVTFELPWNVYIRAPRSTPAQGEREHESCSL